MPVEFNALLNLLGCQSPGETSARFLNDSAFYLEVVSEMLFDPDFEALGSQLTAMDAQAAFDTAHTLKGIIGNCGITPMYEWIVQIVEPLRSGNADFRDLERVYSQLLHTRDEIAAKLKPILLLSPSSDT